MLDFRVGVGRDFSSEVWLHLKFQSFILLMTVNIILHRRSRSDPTRLDSKLCPVSWLSCAPTLRTVR